MVTNPEQALQPTPPANPECTASRIALRKERRGFLSAGDEVDRQFDVYALLNTSKAAKASTDHARICFEIIAKNEALRLDHRGPFDFDAPGSMQQLKAVLTRAVAFVLVEINSILALQDGSVRGQFERNCLPAVRKDLLDRRDDELIAAIRKNRPSQTAASARPQETDPEPQAGLTPQVIEPRNRRRTPDVQLSRQRIELVDNLARELAIVNQETRGHSTVDGLKRKYPRFLLWTLIENSQIKELVDGQPFTPKAYAENLTLIKYGLTSRETLKKDRKKLRNAKKSG